MVSVLELNQVAFEEACARLAEQIASTQPQVLVGIHTGGAVVAAEMHKHLNHLPLFTLQASRGGTGIKKQMQIQRILHHLPPQFNNGLRIAEHYWREWRFEQGRKPKPRNVSLEPALIEWLETNPKRSVVLVDDAVDSGATFAAAIATIRQYQPQSPVIPVSITQTFRHPLVKPQLTLYHDTLVRFPWSLDAQ